MHIETTEATGVTSTTATVGERDPIQCHFHNGHIELIAAAKDDDGHVVSLRLKLPITKRVLNVLRDGKALALREYQNQMMHKPEVVSAIVDGLRKDMEVKDAS